MMVLAFSFVLPSYGPPYQSPQDRFESAHVVLTGEIISYSKPKPPSNLLSSTDTIYQVKVDKYIKNLLEQDILSVIARGGPDAEMNPRSGNVNFDTGDLVYLFLREDKSGMYRVNDFASFRIDSLCEKVPKDISHLTGMPSTWEFQVVDSNLNEKNVFRVGDKVLIRYDAVNFSPTSKTETFSMTIRDGPNDDDKVLQGPKIQDVTLPGCVGHTILQWDFTPTAEGEYFVDIQRGRGSIGFGFQATNNGIPVDFQEMKTPKMSVLKQHKMMMVPDDQLRCHKEGTTLAFKIDGKPACLTPKSLAKLLERGWVAPKQYVPLPDMNLTGKPHPSEVAADAAIKFIESSTTMSFDGTEKNGGFTNLTYKDGSSPTYLIEGRFSTNTSGYGNRENQEFSETKTEHKMIFQIKGSEVIYAVIDNRWDELNQKFVATPSEDFKDFEIRYTKWDDGREHNYYLQFDSRSGLLRVTEGDYDVFFLVSLEEFDALWHEIIQNDFFDMESIPFEPEPGCQCTVHTLKIESGGTHNTVYWYEHDPESEKLDSIMSKITKIVSNQDDEWTQQ